MPSQISKKAVFTADAGDRESYSAVVADGAQAVFGEAALIAAIKGSRLSLSAGVSQRFSVALEQGGFRIHVGSKPVEFALDGFSFETEQAEFVAVRLENGWLVEVVAVFSDKGSGGLRPLRMNVAYPDAGPPAAMFKVGEAVRVEPGSGPVAGSEDDRKHLDEVLSLLTPRRLGPMLVYAKVEDERDLVSLQNPEDENLGEIEIDPIEIEPTCVEICAD